MFYFIKVNTFQNLRTKAGTIKTIYLLNPILYFFLCIHGSIYCKVPSLGMSCNNKVTLYQLTHLLEHGHAMQQGGRSKAFTHIAPVAEKCEEKLMQRMIHGL